MHQSRAGQRIQRQDPRADAGRRDAMAVATIREPSVNQDHGGTHPARLIPMAVSPLNAA